jgi:hypothetical protein
MEIGTFTDTGFYKSALDFWLEKLVAADPR